MPKRNLIWIAALLAAALVTIWVTRNNAPPISRVEPTDFDGVHNTYELIQNEYYRPVNAEKLRRDAVRGMISHLDAYSSYIPPRSMMAFQNRMKGLTCGVGLRLGTIDGKIGVLGPLPNSPAHKAGILAGDLLLAIDNKKLTGADLEDAQQRLRLPAQQQVTLTVERAGGWRKDFTLTSEAFPLESLLGLYRRSNGPWVYLLDEQEGLAYIRIPEFFPETGQDLQRLLQRLGRLGGLILDLRDNPGGMLPATVQVANTFLRKGTIATSLGRDGMREPFHAQANGTVEDIPLVVLIDDQTASAAEIVAGALQLHDRAVLVGSRTRGKGTVQSMLRLPDKLGQINLTTSELLIGDSQPIARRPERSRWGVDPHSGQEIRISADRQILLRALRRQSEVLPAPKSQTPSTVPASQPASRPTFGQQLLEKDTALQRAMALLRQSELMQEILAEAAVARRTAQTLPSRPAETSR